jgi:hypothetical protein
VTLVTGGDTLRNILVCADTRRPLIVAILIEARGDHGES